MDGMTDKVVAGYAERLKSTSSDYQQIQKRVKELIRDVRGGSISPQESHRKQVVSDEDGEVDIELEKKVHKDFTRVIWWALNSDRKVNVKVKDAIMENIDEHYNIDFGSSDHNNRVCMEMIETYYRTINLSLIHI